MSEVKIPEGYKQTEVGVIPEDWEVKELGQIFELKSGETITSKNISSDDFYPCYGGNGLRGYTSTFNRNGEHVLIGRQGALCGNIEYVNDKFFASEHALVVSTIKNYSYKWLAYVLDRMHLNQYSESSAQPGLSALKLKKLKVSLPPIKEQTAIATALSDVDNLIQSLEKTIAKKEAIKTGTMQQLLTGKTRLPEFATREDGSAKELKQTELGWIPEDWEVINFDELLEQTISKKSIKPSTLVTFIGMQDVTGNAQLANQTIVSYEKLKSGFTYFENGDVLLAKITPCFENGKGCHTETLKTKYGFGSTEFHVLRATEYSDSKFLYFWTTRNSFRIDLESTMVGSAGHRRVPFSAVKNYQIPCPPSKSEQTAIATILSDMDAEIQALQGRLKKTKNIKQGMMQQLLTGKVRLAH